MTVTYTTDGGLVGVSFLSAAEGGSGGLDGGFGGGLPSFGRTLLAELTSSLILDEGTGNPTWSRATKAWRFNELGYLQELASGCAAFGGARLVRNTVRTTSEDFSNAAWTKSNCTVTGTNTIVCNNSTSLQKIEQGSSLQSVTAGQYIRYCARVKRIASGIEFLQILGTSSGFGTGQYANYSIIDGTVNAIGCTATSTLVPGTSDTYDISIRLLASATAAADGLFLNFVNNLSSPRNESFIGDGVKSFELLRAWSVDVTNYDASYVPEYVSVGVVSSPFFGAGTDGAKYFETDWQGAPLPAASLLGFRREASAINNLLHCRDLTQSAWTQTKTAGGEVTVNGDFVTDSDWTKGTGWSITGGNLVATAVAGYIQTYQAPLTIGNAYVATLVVDVVTAGGVRINNGTQIGVVAASGVGTFTKSFIATATDVAISATSAGFTGVVSSVSVKLAAVHLTKTATGLDGIANTATTLTAAAADAIILQLTSGISSSARCASAYVKRMTGTGTISFTQDGTNWTDITTQINSSTWSRVQITSTLANPSVGFKISTSGDAIDVDCVQNEPGSIATSPIVTTTATVTRNADSLTYQTASNWSDTAGTAYIEAEPYQWSVGGLIGSATNGLLESASDSGATAYDGTNSANGPTGTPSGRKKLAMRWGSGAITVASGGSLGTPGTYDGGMGLASIGIAVNSSVYCGNVAIYDYAMTDAQLQAITS